MNKQIENFVLLEGNTGIAGIYLASLRKKGKKAITFLDYVREQEPTANLERSLQAISTSFYIDRWEALKDLEWLKVNYLLQTFQNWYYDKLRKRKSERKALKEMRQVIMVEDETTTLEDRMDKNTFRRKCFTWLGTEATEEEAYLFSVSAGLEEAKREGRRYVDFPGGSIGHTTFVKKKNELIEKLIKMFGE